MNKPLLQKKDTNETNNTLRGLDPAMGEKNATFWARETRVDIK